jgi:fructose-1,6-bisphosphatase
MPISVDENDVREVLDGDSSTDYGIEVRTAEAIVNDELAPHSDKTERLKLTGAYIAAAYAKDGGGTLSSVTQGSARISFDTDDALSMFQRAKQMDPTERLAQTEKPSASLSVPDVRGIE